MALLSIPRAHTFFWYPPTTGLEMRYLRYTFAHGSSSTLISIPLTLLFAALTDSLWSSDTLILLAAKCFARSSWIYAGVRQKSPLTYSRGLCMLCILDKVYELSRFLARFTTLYPSFSHHAIVCCALIQIAYHFTTYRTFFTAFHGNWIALILTIYALNRLDVSASVTWSYVTLTALLSVACCSHTYSADKARRLEYFAHNH